MIFLLPLLLPGLALSAAATRLSLFGRRTPLDRRTLERRSAIVGSTDLTDGSDVQYTTNLTLGGLPSQVLIDTGSADLWVAVTGPIPGSVETGAHTSVSYAIGEISGPIKTAKMDFAGYIVNSQAYIEVTANSASPAGQGIIGLGPSTGSNVLTAAGAPLGLTPLENIFLQNTSTPNFITILLGRSDEPTNPFPGDLTIGEYVPGYDNVTSQPKLAVSVTPPSDKGDQHWQTLVDSGGIIGPDGQSVSFTTTVATTKDANQATVVFDSGFSLPQVPKDVSAAFYGRFPTAQLSNVSGVGEIWTLSCKTEVNITFKFGGVSYPVHPLDASLDPTTLGLPAFTASNGDNACLGSFQPTSFQSAAPFDIILGMAFLRNAYLSVNFGDFVDGGSSKAAPFLQLLSTTTPAGAHSDFVQVRLDGIEGQNPTLTKLNPLSGDGITNQQFYIGAGILLAAIIILGSGILFFWRRRRARRAQRYQVLGAPAPAAMGGYGNYPNQGVSYPPNYGQGGSYAKVAYDEPWDHRT